MRQRNDSHIARIVMAGVLLLAAGVMVTSAQEEGASIRADEAAQYVGQTQTVCGTVMGTRFLERSPKKPTFLNIDQEHPNQPLTVVIFGEDRDKFSEPPEKLYAGKKICVTGKITLHRDKPEIVVTDPSAITISGSAPVETEEPAAPVGATEE